MADCGFDGLTSMPGYDLKSDSGLAWLDTMPGYDLQSDCLATR